MSGATRVTRQRMAVSEQLRREDGFRSAQQLHAALRDAGHSIGLATVYRNLALLVESGELDTLAREDGETLYRRCGPTHHHHLVCRGCGRTIEITGPGVEAWANRVADEHGFTHVSHSVELFGLCGDCAGSTAGVA